MRLLTVMLAIAGITLMSTQARAADNAPALTLTIHPPGGADLRDGTLIGSGRVVFQEDHPGYRVWLEAEKRSAAPERYVLRGKHNAAHRLMVQLTGEGWSPDAKGATGLSGRPVKDG